jgi:uncharacterized protein (DUF1330 family)
MAAYLIVQAKITDEAQYRKYRDAVGPVIAKFGGKRLVGTAAVEALEGRHDGRRVIVFEFSSMEVIREWWNSPDYAEVKKLRDGAAVLDVWAVPGAA